MGARPLLATFALIGLLAASATTRAAPVFTASTSLGGGETNSSSAASTGLSSGPASGPNGSTFLLQESALASAGGLRATARSTVNVLQPAGAPGFGYSTSASATWFFDDLLITGPGSAVGASLNLTLDGTFGTNIINLSNLFSAILTSSIGISVTGALDANPFAGSFAQTHDLAAGLFASGGCNPCENTTASASGIISQGPLPVNLVSPVFTLPVNVPFSFALGLNVSATALYQFGGSSCNDSGCSSAFNIDSLADFSHTLSLPATGSILNLPDGFTINSSQASIVNNRLVSATTIPESNALALVALGLLLLVARGRNRRLAR